MNKTKKMKRLSHKFNDEEIFYITSWKCMHREVLNFSTLRTEYLD